MAATVGKETQLKLIEQALEAASVKNDVIYETWANMRTPERESYMLGCCEAVREVNAKRAEKGETLTAEQEDFVEDLLEAVLERATNLDHNDKENVEINKALFQVGRLSSAEARKKDPKQTHATYTALWPLFTQVNSQVEDYSDEEEAAPMRSKKLSKRQQQREQEEDDEVAIFENLISTISLILNIRVNAKTLTYQCAREGCTNKEETVGQFSKCGACKQARYCGPQCQKGDWKPAHKAACKTFVASAHTSYEERRALGQKKIDEGTIVEEDESEEVAKENEIVG